jgi:UDP-N-acetylglucosamine--N-acetylmuramyl-(pentapeptide) pyrophosphoryl-undecaprenol N-acetylglucosamine transferase
MLAAMTTPPRRIVLTGGGSAGHVTPNLALVPELRKMGFAIEYVGSRTGIERELVLAAGLPYHPIDTGKLRRYASWQNLIDPFRTVAGVFQSLGLLRRIRPDVVFSKGGFVAVPVVLAAWLSRIPAVVHESDRSPGLANRLAIPLATRVLTSFEETAARIGPRDRVLCTGAPIRPELLAGDPARAARRFGLEPDRSTVLVFGGSLGARAINTVVGELARALPADLQIVHVCGAGNLDPALASTAHYRAFEYLKEDFPDALAAADVVVSRAGANSLAELLVLRKPAVLIPLPGEASRGDQIQNAERHAERGYGVVLPQAELTRERLEQAVRRLLAERAAYVERMARDTPADAARTIASVLDSVARAART